MGLNNQTKPDVWLASYPRSGNTFCRIVLNECFDLPVRSIYDETASDINAKIVPLMGLHKQHSKVVTKTHERGGADDVPAIYLVRDGRAAVISFLHYQASHGYPTSLEDIILGRVFVGSWSHHCQSWAPTTRPNTLLLRYETLTGDLDTAIEMLAGFLNVRPKHAFKHSFEDLHKGNPEFFRIGSNTRNIAELSAAQLALFDFHHRGVMEQLGYYEPQKSMFLRKARA